MKEPSFFHIYSLGRPLAVSSHGLFHLVGQAYKLLDGQLLRPPGHGLGGEKRGVGQPVLGEHLPDAHAQHLPSLVEDGLHQALEELLVTAQVGHTVARHAYHGALHLWRRVEHPLVHGEEILHVVPRLYEHAQDAVGLRSRGGGHALGHLALDHARAAGDEFLVVEHLEEYLRRDVVGVVAGEHKLAAVENAAEVHAQEILADDVVAQGGEVRVEVVHALLVYLNGLHLPPFRHEILGQHAHAGAYLQDGQCRAGVHRVGDALGDVEVGQEMLSEILFRSYFLHCALFLAANLSKIIQSPKGLPLFVAGLPSSF